MNSIPAPHTLPDSSKTTVCAIWKIDVAAQSTHLLDVEAKDYWARSLGILHRLHVYTQGIG